MKIYAVIRDPKNMRQYHGNSHAQILEYLDEMGDTSRHYRDVFDRIKKVYGAEGSSPSSKHVGFASEDGVFLTRAESLKKWGVYQSTDLRNRE